MFTSADLANMRTGQTDHMQATGNMQPVGMTVDSFGQVIEAWASNSADMICGLEMKPGSEVRGADKVVTTWDAVVRIPITTAVDLRDKFRVTKRFGETLSTPLLFEIVSPIQRGPSGIRLLLRIIST